MHTAFIGLGKMGSGMALRLRDHGHVVTAYDLDAATRARATLAGIPVVSTIEELTQVPQPRTVWLMVPHEVVDRVLEELMPHLAKHDTVIDGGNSNFHDTMRRADACALQGIAYLDAGVSGGPQGAQHGACIMVGGSWDAYRAHEALFLDLATEGGLAYVGKSGAGHFTKMIHNGIEYGMMQAIAEGFDVLRQAEFDISLSDVARLYTRGSVIESRLMGWLVSGFDAYGDDLAGVSGTARASGEGAWTVAAAHELHVPVAVIDASVRAREKSVSKPSFQGQVVSVLRHQFGGHAQ